MLDVVQDQKRCLAAEDGEDRFFGGAAGRFGDAERLGDGEGDELGLRERREGNEDGWAVELAELGQPQSEARLAGAARAGERDEAAGLQEAAQVGELALASDKRCRVSRECARGHVSSVHELLKAARSTSMSSSD